MPLKLFCSFCTTVVQCERCS